MAIAKLDGKREKFVHSLDDQTAPRVDPFALEIIRNRLESTTAEMGIALHRTAHTPVFAETKDFSCSIFDHQGHMVAMGEFLPTHQGGMQNTVDGIIDELGLESFGEGDIFMVNDALHGACHSQDITLVAPIYYDHQFLGATVVVVHHLDTGGMSPSSYCPKATEIYQEGIRFPPTTKLYEGGKLRRDILNILLTNIRMPEPSYGDLMAQVAACHVGARRVCELAAKYGVEAVRDTFLALQHAACNAARKAIAAMPDGVYVAEDYIDGDGIVDVSYKIRCALTIEGARMTLDFTGTDPQAKGFVNSQWGNTSANAYPAVMSFMPSVPRNYGTTVPLELIAEKGTVVNPTPTAAIGSCTTESGYIIHNVVIMCLNQANPALATGVWGGIRGVHMSWGIDPRTDKYYVAIHQSGGCTGGGARRTKDGWPIASLKGSNVNMPNIEIEEHVWPFAYQFRRLATHDQPCGCGPGRYRGGPGVEYEVGPLGHDLQYSTILGKYRHPADGVFGGGHGGTSRAVIRDRATGEVKREVSGKSVDDWLKEGETIRVTITGGGGYGSAIERDPERVRKDVIEEFCSLETARAVYGVVLDPQTLEIDREATEALRAQ